MKSLYMPESQLMIADKFITQEQINQYAEVSDDRNPLHIDQEFAKTTTFKGTIAHGLLSAAFLNEMMVKYFGTYWETTGDISITFLYPVRPGDTIKTKGKIINIDTTGRVTIELQCVNQDNKKVIVGQAYVITPPA